MALPDQQILANVRRDGTGTTFTFTDYLTKVNAEWKKQVGAGMLAQWPIGLPENGNEAVADAVRSEAGAIGYVELSYAFAKDLPYALMQNRAGAWTDASPQTITGAAAGIADQMPGDLQQSITNAPGPSAYPISSYSYLLFFKQQNDPAKADAFRKFVDWILHDGQAYAAPLHYAPLPEGVAGRTELQLKQIEIASRTGTATASCKASLGLAKGSNAGPRSIRF
jgi:phosphate transport system substrate-binding protein